MIIIFQKLVVKLTWQVLRGCPKQTSTVRGEESLSNANILRTRGRRGSSDADVSGAKNIGFFEIYGMSARTRWVGPVRTFFGQEGQFFANLCGRPFWTAPYFSLKRHCILEPAPFQTNGSLTNKKLVFFLNRFGCWDIWKNVSNETLLL